MLKRIQFIVFLIVIFVLTLILTGCNNKDNSQQDAELVILCGNSFINPTEHLYNTYSANDVDFSMTTSGSEDFLPLIKTGKKGDILVTHDPYLDYAAEAGAVEDSVHVGYVAPVLAVQPGNPKDIQSIEDLKKPGIKVALSNPQYSTCGEMVFNLLEKKGIKEDVMKNVGNRLTKGHPNLCNLLKTQTVDAIITWNGVAHTFRDSLEIVPTPYEYDEEIRVHVISLNYSESPGSLADFMEYVKENGPDIYSDYGYVK